MRNKPITTHRVVIMCVYRGRRTLPRVYVRPDRFFFVFKRRARARLLLYVIHTGYTRGVFKKFSIRHGLVWWRT